ncbi:substrate-binding periplasmic protein [Chitinimonas naiadis]
MRRLIISLIPVFLFCHAAEPLLLRTASQAGNSVKFNLASTDEPGICVEILRAMERVDTDLHFTGLDQEKPLLRIESELANGQIEVFFGLLRTADRQQKMRYIDHTPLYVIRHQVAVRADDSVAVETFEDIRALGQNGLILVPMGTAYIDYLKRQGGLILDIGSNSNVDNFKKLLAGRGRFFYQADTTLKRYIRDQKLVGQVRILPAVFRLEPQMLVTSRQLSEDKVARLSSALAALAKSGELQRIQRKYGVM